jgi:hypothetical protein
LWEGGSAIAKEIGVVKPYKGVDENEQDDDAERPVGTVGVGVPQLLLWLVSNGSTVIFAGL